MNEIVEVVEQGVSAIIQAGIDAGIPFDSIPKTSGEIAHFNGCLQWVIFTLTIAVSAVNSLVRSSMGAIR